MTASVVHADCREVMRGLDAESVDAIVCDPPYGLSFMGKEWDHGVPGVEFWAEALRVAKPGAHLVAFGGSRTFHRLAVAIEDAGWKIRDCLSWLYGSGFPKSLDIGKQMDKRDPTTTQQERRYRFTAWVRSTGVTARQIDEATGTRMGNHYTTHTTQPAVMTTAHLNKCRHLLGDIPEWVEAECEQRSVESAQFASREVVGTRPAPDFSADRPVAIAAQGKQATARTEINITAPATDLARQWHGWGTALKPAWEPIILARKPLPTNVADNVMRHRTGGLNVDGCRISAKGRPNAGTTDTGRWPANVLLDEDAAALLGEPSRFFYTAKASRREREAGLEGMPERVAKKWNSGGIAERRAETAQPLANVHPTVKPIAVMRWLCRLVTPPGGRVFDPFAGSGTTGCAAVLEGFSFLGAELDESYAEIARRRIAYWMVRREAEPLELPLGEAERSPIA